MQSQASAQFRTAGIDLVGRGVVVRVDDAHAGERAVGFAAAQAIRDVIEDNVTKDKASARGD
jgi:moderate conductance mechanosensitive channel